MTAKDSSNLRNYRHKNNVSLSTSIAAAPSSASASIPRVTSPPPLSLDQEDSIQSQNQTNMSSSSSSSSASTTPTAATNNSSTHAMSSCNFLAPNSPAESKVSSSHSTNSGDTTFEPTVDMMVNDFDDEQTLEEEEALAAQEFEDPSAELSNLQKESDMPIEELLALYNCSGALLNNLPGANNNTNRGNNSNNDDSTASTDKTSSSNTKSKRKLKPQRITSNTVITSDTGNVEYTTAATINENNQNNENTSNDHDDENDDEDAIDDEIDNDEDEDDDDIDDIDGSLKNSQLRKLYPETYGNDKRLLRTISRQQSDEDDDAEYSPDEDEFKKTIMVGSEYQAIIPEGFSKYDDALPYENEDKLLWEPDKLTEKQVEKYLTKIKSLNATNSDAIPNGNHLRDDEQALYLLMQCGYNTEEALRRIRLNPATATASSDEMSIWSEDECRNFESGIRIYGKDFYTTKHTKVKTRSVGELVQFYYLWKKTERHDVFANKARLEKKKYSLHPGLTDYMDRFLEEQESNNSTSGSTSGIGNNGFNNSATTLQDRSSSPTAVNSLLQADTKRHNLKIHHRRPHLNHHYGGTDTNSVANERNTSTGKLINSKHNNHFQLPSTSSNNQSEDKSINASS